MARQQMSFWYSWTFLPILHSINVWEQGWGCLQIPFHGPPQCVQASSTGYALLHSSTTIPFFQLWFAATTALACTTSSKEKIHKIHPCGLLPIDYNNGRLVEEATSVWIHHLDFMAVCLGDWFGYEIELCLNSKLLLALPTIYNSVVIDCNKAKESKEASCFIVCSCTMFPSTCRYRSHILSC
jgi:hypothetical protein